MNFVLANLDWNNWKELWKDPSIQIQFSILIGLIVFVFALTKLTKPLVISLSENNENSDLKKRFWNNISRMVAPLYLLTSCLLAVAVVERFSISSQD